MFTCVCSIALSLMSCVFSWQSLANLSKWARSSVLISALWTSSFTSDSEYESKLNWNSCVSSYPTRATKLWRSSSLSLSLSDLVSLKHTRDFSFFRLFDTASLSFYFPLTYKNGKNENWSDQTHAFEFVHHSSFFPF